MKTEHKISLIIEPLNNNNNNLKEREREMSVPVQKQGEAEENTSPFLLSDNREAFCKIF